MADLKINGVLIQDDYSETFGARVARILVTSLNDKWAYEAAMETKGLGRSATAPPCEATLERAVAPADTPDGRPGYLIQVMDRKLEKLTACLALRIRKGAVPNPQTSVFDALDPQLATQTLDLEGTVIPRFGDGFETEMEAFGRQVYRIPRMDGWFHVQRKFGICEGVTGGMYLILGDTIENTLAAAEASLASVGAIDNIVVKCAASGSKVGAKNYTDMVATTNDSYCPKLVDNPDRQVPDGVGCIYEIIVSGPRGDDVRAGMRAGIEAATQCAGVREIHTANYGGKLGSGKIQLHGLFA